MLLQVVDQKNKKVSEVELASWLGEKVNQDLLYYTVKAQHNNLRRGTARTKTRAEVNRTGKKLYKQKGTGNARHGSRKVNIYVGGGNVHGPQPRSYFESLNKSAKQRAYQEIFKHLVQNDLLKVVDRLDFAKASTKSAAQVLKNLGVSKAVVYLPQEQDNAKRSFRNLRDVVVANEGNLNVFEMLKCENVVVTAPFLEKLKERYGL